MMYRRNVISVHVLLLMGFVTIAINGDSENHGVYNDKLLKRSLTSDAVKGVLAWRKLLWDSKPASTNSKHGILRFYKAGDFGNALTDFLSVVPTDKNFKQLGDLYRGRMYIGKVGDRQVVLRERGPYTDLSPTIEISNGHRKDKIIYMGKGWGKSQ